MTKKDFIKIAAALKKTKPIMYPDTDVMRQWEKDVYWIKCVLRESNNRFDEDKFLEACDLIIK